MAAVGADEEKRKALALFVAKYSPDYREIGAKNMQKWRTVVSRMDIERISGKAKHLAALSKRDIPSLPA